MNSKQKYVSIAVAILLTIASLFPPFYLVAEVGTVNRGFHFIFSDQTPATVNTGLLFMEWLFIVSLAFIGWLFFKDSE
jgi:hypothetical protein